MLKISVALAVYNEENHLKDCLEAVKNLAWETVVVDGGSSDRTVEIAKSFKVKIIQTDNPSNFHINKNKAIDACTGEWILQLDADEVVTDQLKKEIKEAVSKNSSINGYWIPRSNFFLGRFLKKGGQYPDYTLRLYRKGKGRLPAKDVHEQAEVVGGTGYLKNPLLHTADKTFDTYIVRWNRYTELLSSQIDKPDFAEYFLFKPIGWFLRAYIRHKGFMDGFPGFVFAFFSSLRFPVTYIKYEIKKKKT